MEHDTLGNWYEQLLRGYVRAVRVLPTVLVGPVEGSSEALVFPGAFNPLHAGHRAMADVAEQRCGRAVEFEISRLNVDKPPLAIDDLVRRAEQFPPQQSVWITRAARFTEKAELFPGATFVVGIDTVARLAEPRYSDGDAARALRAIEQIAAWKCRFLVFGRLAANGFQTLSQLNLPPALAAICDEVPEAAFRHDVSSTELRIAERKMTR